MKINYCSDLHLDHPENTERIKNNPLESADVLILAGDIGLLKETKKYDWFWDDISLRFKHVYWIPGNHEWYHDNMANRPSHYREAIRYNVFLINNETVELNGIRIICSTLWSKIRQENEWVVRKGSLDFRKIIYSQQAGTLMPSHYNILHQYCRDFIVDELGKSYKGITIVATHFVPTFMNYPEQYRGDILNETFAVEMFDVIDTHQPDYWIFGHTHTNVEFNIGKTLLTTNQLGYTIYHENTEFKSKIITV